MERAGKKGEAESDLVAFVKGCLNMDPSKRPSATELLNGKYIAKQKTKLVYEENLAKFAKEVLELREELERKWIEENDDSQPRGYGGLF